jgi:hypothetical protein
VSGSPILRAAVAVGAKTATINTFPGRTVQAGDMLGIGGQLVRVVANATADGTGALAVEFLPRLRAAAAQGSVVTWDKPTATFMLKGDGAPTTWRPGAFEGPGADFIETP